MHVPTCFRLHCPVLLAEAARPQRVVPRGVDPSKKIRNCHTHTGVRGNHNIVKICNFGWALRLRELLSDGRTDYLKISVGLVCFYDSCLIELMLDRSRYNFSS